MGKIDMSDGEKYDPAKHHRRSIRLKGHDYAGGGLYFVTLCAHREFVAWAKGVPFGAKGAARMPPERSPRLLKALEENRLLILEMRNRDGDLAAAEARNRFVIGRADSLFVPHVSPNGMLDWLLKETKEAHK